MRPGIRSLQDSAGNTASDIERRWGRRGASNFLWRKGARPLESGIHPPLPEADVMR